MRNTLRPTPAHLRNWDDTIAIAHSALAEIQSEARRKIRDTPPKANARKTGERTPRGAQRRSARVLPKASPSEVLAIAAEGDEYYDEDDDDESANAADRQHAAAAGRGAGKPKGRGAERGGKKPKPKPKYVPTNCPICGVWGHDARGCTADCESSFCGGLYEWPAHNPHCPRNPKNWKRPANAAAHEAEHVPHFADVASDDDDDDIETAALAAQDHLCCGTTAGVESDLFFDAFELKHRSYDRYFDAPETPFPLAKSYVRYARRVARLMSDDGPNTPDDDDDDVHDDAPDADACDAAHETNAPTRPSRAPRAPAPRTSTRTRARAPPTPQLGNFLRRSPLVRMLMIASVCMLATGQREHLQPPLLTPTANEVVRLDIPEKRRAPSNPTRKAYARPLIDPPPGYKWVSTLVDSGCTLHLLPFKTLYEETIPSGVHVRTANHSRTPVELQGPAMLHAFDEWSKFVPFVFASKSLREMDCRA